MLRARKTGTALGAAVKLPHFDVRSGNLFAPLNNALSGLVMSSEIPMKEEIVIDGRTCAILLRAGSQKPGIYFFTANELSQQLASMSYGPGKKIGAHTHNEVPREVFYTQETLFIRKGKIRVDFFSDDHEYHSSRVLATGDVILLIAGGHGFEVLEDLDMVEVKQGPYVGEEDKTRFEGRLPDQLNFD